MQESLIRRIQKLRDLSNRNDNEAEAALAAQRMTELLLEHGLSMAEIDAKTTKDGGKVTDAKRVKESHHGSAMYEYQRSLMRAIAETNFCVYWVEERWRPDPKGGKVRWLHDRFANKSEMIVDGEIQPAGQVMGRIVKSHILLGREDYVVSSGLMYEYLTETMDRLLPWQGMQKRGKDALLWLAGCTERLTERLNDKRWQMEREQERKRKEQEARGEIGLILLSDLYNSEEDLNEDFREGLEPGTTGRRKMEQKERYRRYKEDQDRLIADGMDSETAWYVARGLTVPEMTVAPKVQESEAEKIKREKREARERGRSEARWQKEAWKNRQKRNSEAYQLGNKKGLEIGLDTQIRDRKTERLA